jgi:hypothetical protein
VTGQEPNCPLPNTHRRLADAYNLWQLAAASYEDPDTFRMYLNALLEATRNITFMLQSEKAVIPGFDEWYPDWQETMGRDVALVWARDARTQVVHQGDLETHSTAHVRVQASWEEPPITTFDVPPHVPTTAIASRLAEQEIPEDVRRGGVLTVERRWVVDELPNHELLDVVAHCLDIIRQLVRAAHRRAGSAMDSVDDDQMHPVVTREMRTVTVNLRTNEILRSDFREVTLVPEEETAKHYGPFPEAPRGTNDPLAWADYYMEMGRLMLAKDGFHTMIAFLFHDHQRPQMLSTMPEDQQGKYLFMQQVANTVQRTGATGLVFTAESWMAKADDVPPGKRPADVDTKLEMLTVTAARADGATRVLASPFTHTEDGEIRLGDVIEVEGGGELFLGPVLRVWGFPAPSEEETAAQWSRAGDAVVSDAGRLGAQ